MILNILSRFGFKSHSLADAENMSLHEYVLRTEAYELEREDKIHDIHLQSWANVVVHNQKGEGDNARPMYTRFDDFYDSEKARDYIRDQYEKDYVKLSDTEQKEKTAGDVRVERMIQYEKMKKAQKKSKG